jgi:hypothetical protein
VNVNVYKGGFVREQAMRSVERIYDRTEAVFERADEDRVPATARPSGSPRSPLQPSGQLRSR